jgi:phosphatidylserine/phosphatidylglycerophosphate/cardiolipin synthase-like enzyme
MFELFDRPTTPTDLLNSKLFNEDTFYPAFLKDVNKCHSELIIECPFITCRRLKLLLPTLEKLKHRRVRIVVNTRDPRTQGDEYRRDDAHEAIAKLQRLGVQVIFTDNHHRKLAIIDRSILYEGSLNVLSQNNSCEIMRRIESVKLAWQMVHFTEIDTLLN